MENICLIILGLADSQMDVLKFQPSLWEGGSDALFLNDSGTYNNDLTGTGLTQSADQIKGDGKYVLD